MFYDGSYAMGGMHGLWWFFWLVFIGVLVFYGWGGPSEKRRRPRESPLDTSQKTHHRPCMPPMA